MHCARDVVGLLTQSLHNVLRGMHPGVVIVVIGSIVSRSGVARRTALVSRNARVEPRQILHEFWSPLADLPQGHTGGIHSLEQADPGAEQHR
jgi:hypothetical protein